MIDELCDDETIVGYGFVVEKKGLFGKKFSRKPITYGYIIREVLCELYKIDTETIYEDIELELEKEIRKNYIEKLDFTRGGIGKGRTKTERRINFLQFKFKDSYLKKTLELFSKH